MYTLPTFANPPINELVLSIQFASLNVTSAHIGMFWERVRGRYPDCSEQPVLQPTFETFGGVRTAPIPGTFTLEGYLIPPMPRYWFERRGQPDLFQFQRDRAVRNWRQAPDDGRVYPRYEAVREAFVKDLADLQAWLEHENLGTLAPNQCEVTYISLIRLPEGSNPHTQLHRISPLWSNEINPVIGDRIENSNVQLVCVFQREGRPAGRIYTSFQSSFMLSSLEPVVRLEITARGKPAGDSVADALEFLDVARSEVVTTFTALTTKEMHKFWGRTDG